MSGFGDVEREHGMEPGTVLPGTLEHQPLTLAEKIERVLLSVPLGRNECERNISRGLAIDRLAELFREETAQLTKAARETLPYLTSKEESGIPHCVVCAVALIGESQHSGWCPVPWLRKAVEEAAP